MNSAASFQPVTQPFIHPTYIGGNWTIGGALHLVLAQLKRSTIEEMTNDSRRAHAVTAIMALFTDPRSTTEHLLEGGTNPRVVVAPELAIGSGDWTCIDAAVRQSRADTILIIGCGFVSGQWILNWLASPSAPTRRHAAWPDGGEEIATARPYNIGFAWIKINENCRCVLFLKNFSDQSMELATVPNLANGRWMTRLDADDLVIFPTICSELLAHIDTGGNPSSAATRIRQSLNLCATNGRRILITGSLLTSKPGHGLWSRALQHCVETVGPGHIVALTNAAMDGRVAHTFPCWSDANEDGWRNRTGVFKPRAVHTELDGAPGCLTLSHRETNLVAVIARETFALIQGGCARWDQSITNGAFLWHPIARAMLDSAGAIANIGNCEPITHEAVRLALRHQAKVEPNPANAGSQNPHIQQVHDCECFRSESARTLVATLVLPESPWPAKLLRTLVSGLHSTTEDLKEFTDDPTCWPHIAYLFEGLDAAAIISHEIAPNWQTLPNFNDRAMHQGLDRAFVVWSSPRHTRHEMNRAISIWQCSEADACNLVVIGQSKNHDFEEGAMAHPLPREDISQPEAVTSVRDITDRRRNRIVTRVSLGRLREACEPVVDVSSDVRTRILSALGIAV